MKQKTAMQELIEEMEYFESYSPIARRAIMKGKELLEKEKQQIIDTYLHVASEHCDFTLHSETKVLYAKEANKYYNQTYKQ